MSEQLTFWQLYNKSVGLLNEKRLAEALSLIHRLVDKTANWQLELHETGSERPAKGTPTHKIHKSQLRFD